jgi:tetratricopeptide (TPR) repeat protein
VRTAERLLGRRPGEVVRGPAGNPDDDMLRGLAADAAAGLGRADQAVRLLRPLVDRRPDDEALILRYVTLTAEAGKIEEGLRAHRRLVAALASPSFDHRVRLARLLTDLGRHAEAIAEYESALAEPAGRPARAERADRPDGAQHAGPSDGAQRAGQPDGGEGAGRPESMEGAGRPEGAERIAARAALAQLYDWTGAGERALRQWEALARLRARDPAVLREVGRRAMALSRSELALRAYRALLAELPDDPEALKRVGQILVASKDARGARMALERFNRVKGGDYEVHVLLAEVYDAEGDGERARAEYDKALRLLPAQPRRR